MLRRLPLLVALSLGGSLLAACEDAAPAQEAPAATGCSATGCPEGQRCGADDRCSVDDGSGGQGPDACGSSDDCWPSPPTIVPNVWWDGGQSGLDLICTTPAASCPGGGCRVPTECLEPLDDGLPGSFACASDDQCASGRCVDTGAVKLCLRACKGQLECPFEHPVADPDVGFVCGEVEERGVTMRSCVPADPARPTATLCRRDCDCTPGGSLLPGGCPAPVAGEATCRFVGGREPDLHAVPLCEVPPPGPLRPTGARCLHDPGSCEGGACGNACQLDAPPGETDPCLDLEWRCSRPCTKDFDCPARMICTTGKDGERVGEWPGPGPNDRGRDVLYCQLPVEGCFDQRDCCPQPDGAGGCEGGWTVEPRRCAITISGARPRLLTKCVSPDPALRLPGACCTEHAACDSALCVPAKPGSPCAGSGVCTVPCDPDPEGLPGAGDERELCASGGLGPAFDATRCEPFLYELPTIDEQGAPQLIFLELHACQ